MGNMPANYRRATTGPAAPLRTSERALLDNWPADPTIGQHDRGPRESGERRLLRALLLDAIALVVGVEHYERPERGRSAIGLRAEARAWILAMESRVCGFSYVCDHLQLDPDATARAVLVGDTDALARLGIHASAGRCPGRATNGRA